MNNLLSYCGLVDAKIRASDKDLLVKMPQCCESIKSYILDHWGKGSPSAAETAVLDLEVEILKQQAQ